MRVLLFTALLLCGIYIDGFAGKFFQFMFIGYIVVSIVYIVLKMITSVLEDLFSIFKK
jgi:hypothetical protein